MLTLKKINTELQFKQEDIQQEISAIKDCITIGINKKMEALTQEKNLRFGELDKVLTESRNCRNLGKYKNHEKCLSKWTKLQERQALIQKEELTDKQGNNKRPRDKEGEENILVSPTKLKHKPRQASPPRQNMHNRHIIAPKTPIVGEIVNRRDSYCFIETFGINRN